LLSQSGGGAWEHGCGGVVKTVRVDVVGYLAYDDWDWRWKMTCEVGFVLAGLVMGNTIEFQHKKIRSLR
jgi:hypothetical protein